MRFQCSSCGRIVAVDDVDAGIMVQCGHCGSVVQVPPTRLSRGSVIADFIIRRTIGQGGMGTVYLSHQITLDRPAALKILAESYTNNAEFVSCFIKEARAAAKLNHPHIVQAYAVGEDDGLLYFAMENIDGETMKDVLEREGVIPVDQALNIIQQIAEALNYAWNEQKLIHCDIKPDNIMLTSTGRAKLADLGLARVTGDMSDAADDEVMGTPQYISPEALTGAPMDTRSDIYSLGATFYQLVTGRLAFDGATAAEIAKKHLAEPLIPPRSVNKDIPESVSRIIIKMMAKNPSMRYQDASELIDDLRNARRGKTAGPSTESEILSAGGSPSGRVARPIIGSAMNPSVPAGYQNDRARNIYNLKKRQQDEARRTRIMILFACLILLIALGAGLFLFLRNNAAAQERKRKEAEEKARQEELERDTELTLAVDAIEKFAEEYPTRKADLLKMCEDFILKDYHPGKPKEEQAMNRFEADFLKADESMISDGRKSDLYALRKDIEDRMIAAEKRREQAEKEARARQDAINREKYERDQAEEAEADSIRKARELAEELAREKERFAGRMVTLTLSESDKRGASKEKEEQTKASAEGEYADWFKQLDSHVRNDDERSRETARPYRDWARFVLDGIASAKEIRENTYNGKNILEGAQVGYTAKIGTGSAGICTVKSINNGIVKAVQVGGRQIQFNFDDLELKQRLALLRKGAGEAGLSDSLYFYLLLYGEFDGAKEVAADDEKAQEICRYVITSYFKYEIERAGKDEKALSELKSKYGNMPEFKDAMSALNK